MKEKKTLIDSDRGVKWKEAVIDVARDALPQSNSATYVCKFCLNDCRQSWKDYTQPLERAQHNIGKELLSSAHASIN
jgi:hypothetical protein